MKPKVVIKIVILNQSMNISTSRGNNSASDVTENKLIYSSDYHPWWVLVRLVINCSLFWKLQLQRGAKDSKTWISAVKPKTCYRNTPSSSPTHTHISSPGEMLETKEAIPYALPAGQWLLWSSQLEKWVLLMWYSPFPFRLQSFREKEPCPVMLHTCCFLSHALLIQLSYRETYSRGHSIQRRVGFGEKTSPLA